MFSFDSITMNIILIVAVVVLFTFFITVLLKLNPSTETRQKLQVETAPEKEKPLKTPPIVIQRTPPTKVDITRDSQKPVVTQPSPKASSPVQIKQQVFIDPSTESNVTRNQGNSATTVKTQSAPSKNDCLHHFRYLSTLPKNAPIPDECFGCLKVVDCLIKPKTMG